MKKIIISLLLTMTILTACSKQTPVQLTTNSDNMIPTDWKTFTSSNLDDNFEIRYPSNWKVEERNHIVSFAPRDFDWLKTTDENGIKEGDFSFALNISDKASPENSYTIARNNFQNSQTNCPKTIIANIEIFRCVLESEFDCDDTNNIQFRFKRGDIYYEGVTMYKCNGKDNEIGDKILSTLKFTK